MDGVCDIPPLDTAMQEAGFEDMVKYVLKRNNMVAQYIATRSIMELCEVMVRIPGTWLAIMW